MRQLAGFTNNPKWPRASLPAKILLSLLGVYLTAWTLEKGLSWVLFSGNSLAVEALATFTMIFLAGFVGSVLFAWVLE